MNLSNTLKLLPILAALLAAGCGEPLEPPLRQTITYTFDAPTRELIRILEEEGKVSEYKKFDRYFKGLLVPEPLLPFEPFVLGLSTESKIPAVLLLDAPWVQRYGMAGWLYELEATRVFSRDELAPPVAEAFSVMLSKGGGKPTKELVAVPTYIKGNILFYRQDLLKKHHVKPPRTWEELVAACGKILPQEPLVKYGLIFHATNFLNDFYPILWGYGGQVLDGEGRLVLGEEQNLAACLAALRDLKGMMGTVTPKPEDLKQFEAVGSLRRTFYRGEALFMINWNTRLRDLSEMMSRRPGMVHGSLTDAAQVGVSPIPCRRGHPNRYSNIGSFGWGVNRFAVTNPHIIERAKNFISLVTQERFQLLAAENLGQVPALRRALDKVTNKEVLQVYNDTFAVADMRLKPRPHSRRINNILEKNLAEFLNGQRSPEETLEKALQELKASVAS
jgi:multiple sugar transport system substrate-binding protein